MTIITAYKGVLSPGEIHLDIYPPRTPPVNKPGVVHLHGASGNGWTVLNHLNDGKPHTPNHIALNGNVAIAADAGGPQTWGNQAAIDGAERSYNKLQSMRGVKPGKAFLVGSSMGGLTALNWAANNATKIAGIIMVIPVINLNDIKVNNRGGYASLVNAAHGGNYDELTMGFTKNPRTIANSGKYSNIPMLIFYGTNDAVCVPGEVIAFKNAVGDNVELVPMNSGHDLQSYLNVDNARIIDFINRNS